MTNKHACLLLALGWGAASSHADPANGTGDADTLLPLPAASEIEPEVIGESMLEESHLRTRYNSFTVGDGKTVTWGGRVMFDTAWFSGDSMYPVSLEDAHEFRRARFFAEIDVNENVSAKAQYDFAGGDADFADVYLKFKTNCGTVIAGHHFQPFSLEQLTSSKYITFMERAMPVEAFAPARDSGVTLSDRIGEDTNWSVGVFRISDDFGDGAGDGDYGYTGRITHALHQGEDSTIHLGLAASVWGSQDIRVRVRPEAHILDRVFDTTTLPSDGSTLLGAEFAWIGGPTSVQAEYMMQSIDEIGGPGGQDVDFSGFYAFVSHFLTGESRAYKTKGGKFGRVTPNSDWDGGLGGAWEAALRYSMVDFDDGPFTSDVANITAALNWYMNAYTRMMFNVIQSDVDDGTSTEDMTAFMIRLQVDW